MEGISVDQAEVLERLYGECPRPTRSQRLEMISQNPILSDLDSDQIKVWFQDSRCRQKQRKEAIKHQTVNQKLTAAKKLLLAENDRLQKDLLQLNNENIYIRKLLHNTGNGVEENALQACSALTSSPIDEMFAYDAMLQSFGPMTALTSPEFCPDLSNMGGELLRSNYQSCDSESEQLWYHQDNSQCCCAFKVDEEERKARA